MFFIAFLFAGYLGIQPRRPAVLTLTSVSLRVDAWTGWPARPQVTTWPLDRVRLSHHRVADQPLALHRLTIEAGAGLVRGTCAVDGLACTTEELEQLVALVESRRDDARARTGDGETEVPADLKKFLRTTQTTG